MDPACHFYSLLGLPSLAFKLQWLHLRANHLRCRAMETTFGWMARYAE